MPWRDDGEEEEEEKYEMMNKKKNWKNGTDPPHIYLWVCYRWLFFSLLLSI